MSPSDILAEAARLRADLPVEFADTVVEKLHAEARRIARTTVRDQHIRPRIAWEQRLDAILTHRIGGFIAMGTLFYLVFWITIIGSAVPSALLFRLLVEILHPDIKHALLAAGCPQWLTGLLADGVYLGTAWVIAVMLPPMAIFFPLFTLLEDFGYLPRVAFNLDRLFARAGADGKQALTMMMGFGCNAAGVTATRIISSPRERLIAIITNNFSVCNGRWPTLILMGTIFLGRLAPAPLAGTVAAVSVVAVALLGVGVTLVVSWLLSRTVLRGETSFYTLELPPYRRPQLWRTLATSAIDRTLKVLWRAIVMAAPAGAVIWLIANVDVGHTSVAGHAIDALQPLGLLVGLNGIVVLAYVVAVPANEIVIPTILMLTVASQADGGQTNGVLMNLSNAQAATVLTDLGGWTVLTGLNLMLFSLLHNPCSTTVLTIWKETRNAKWTAVATLLPLALAFIATFCTATAFHLAGFSN